MDSFLKSVAEDLYKKLGLGIQHCAIVFNNKRPALYLQKHFADIVGKPFFAPSFYTIQDLFDQAVIENIADPYLQFFTLHKIYNELLIDEGLPILSSSQFYPLAKIILSDFSQIDNDLVNADALYKEMADIATINLEFDFLTPEQYSFLSQFWASYSEGKHKRQQELFILMWRRMPKLYHRFHEALAANGWITHGGSYRKLANIAIEENPFFEQYNKIVFVGFNALSKAEEQLFVKLQKAEKALFYFDIDEYYYNDLMQEAGFFLRKNIHRLHLKNEFTKATNYFTTQNHKIDVYKVQGQSTQAKILNQLLSKEYQQQEQENTTAIVLADESLLIPTLQTIPSKVGGDSVVLNVTMGFPLAASTVLGLVKLWLDCQKTMIASHDLHKHTTSYVTYIQLESFLTHPLIHISREQKKLIRAAVLRENLVWVPQNRLSRRGGVLEFFFTQIKEPAQLVSSLAEMLQVVLNILSGTKQLKEIDAQLLVATIRELNKLNESISRFLEGEAHHFVASLILKAVSDIAVPLSGDPLYGIQVMGLLESRNLNFNKIIFLGFNEGVVPKTSLGNSFIPDSLRRAHGLPVLEILDSISAYMVYRLVQRAENISIVYNNLTGESTSGEPSRFLKQLEYESPFQFDYHELALGIRTEEKREITIDKTHPLIQEKLQLFLKGKKYISPSALTTYIANPVDFFFRYIAGIEEPDIVTEIVDAKEIGSILHLAMELFYEPVVANVVTKEWIVLNRSSNELLIKKAFFKVRKVENINTYEFAGVQLVVLAIVKAYMDIILDEDERYAPFTLIALERKIKSTVDFKVNGKMEGITINGTIDRIDEKDGITRIVDYKTGSDKLSFTDDMKQLFSIDGKSNNKALIQTMIYTYALEQFDKITGVQPVLYVVKTMSESGIYFYNKRNKLELQFLEDIKPEFEYYLKATLEELFDESIPFRVSQAADNYSYSKYKTLFGA